MEPQGLSFGQPVSIVCPVIRSPQNAAREQQRGFVSEPAAGLADEPCRRQGAAAADSTDRSAVLRAVTASQPSAADADNSRAVLMYVGKDGDTSPPRPPSRADDAPPAAEEAPTPDRLDPLIVLCQAAQQQGYETEESEQQVPLGPEVHFGELSFADTSPQNTDAGQYEEAMDGSDELHMEENELPMEEVNELTMEEVNELTMEEHHELLVEEHHELLVEEHHELLVEEHHELPVDERLKVLVGKELPVQEQQHKIPVQEQEGELPVQEHQGELPVQEHQGELPVQERQGELPIQEQQRELPVQEQQCEHPVQEQQCEPPAQEQHHELLVQEGHYKLPVKQQCLEVPLQQPCHELPVQQLLHELPLQESNIALPVQEQCQLPTQDHQELVVQEHAVLAVREHYQPPAASAPTPLVVPLRTKDVAGECGLRQVDVTGTALLLPDTAAGHGALMVTITPGYQGEAVTQPATRNQLYLYSEAQQVYAAPLPQVESIPVVEGESTALTQYIDEEVRRQLHRMLKVMQSECQSHMLTCIVDKDKQAKPPASGRESPSVLRFSTRHGKRQLHLSLNCDGETCCKSQDTPSYVSDSTVQISQVVEASPSETVNKSVAIENRPQNTEGESQKTDKEAHVTIATPDSTADTHSAGGQGSLPEDPVQEETTECTSDAQSNSNTTESENSGPPSATQDATETAGPPSATQVATETTDTSPDEMADENLKNSDAKRDDTVGDSAPSRCCTKSEVKNLVAKPPLGRRRKNPIRRRIVPATPSSGRKPVSRKRGAATLSDSVVNRGRRQTHAAELVPSKESEKKQQQQRGKRRSAQEIIRAGQAAVDASERPNAASRARSTVRKAGGRRRGGSAAGSGRRRPVVAASPSPRVDSAADEAPAAASRGTRRKRHRDSADKPSRSRSRSSSSSRSSHGRDEWMLQPLASQPGQDPPLKLLVKRRTLTMSESSDLPSEYAVKEDIIPPLRTQVEDIEKSKPVQRRRRHSTNDCQSNQQESQRNNPLHFSKNTDERDSSVQWRKRRKPAPLRFVNCEEGISKDADTDDDDGGDDDDDEDWVPKSYKHRKSVTGGHNNSNKRINLAKRRKSVASGTDELSQIPCTETVVTMTASPEQLAETNKEESLITSTDTLPISEGYKTTAAETVVTALTDTCKSSVEEHVSDTTHISMPSHTPCKYNQPVVSQTQQKVSCNTDESCQEPVPKKYKKAWQELWSAQQNDEQVKASLPQAPHNSEELHHREERCTRDPTQLSTAETSASSSSNIVPPSSSSHMTQQETSELQSKGKTSETDKTSSELTEDPHTMSDDSVETLSDTTTDESDNECSPVTIQKCRSVVPHREVPVRTLLQPEGLTSQQPQGFVSEGFYNVNGRLLKVRVQEMQDGSLDPALSQVPREIIEHCVLQLKRSNELVPSVHSLRRGLLPLKYISPNNLDIKPFICQHTGHKLKCPSHPPSTHIKQEPVDDNQLNSQPPIFAPSSGIFPYAGQPLGYSNVVIQTEGCCRKACCRRKGFAVENEKHGSQNNDVIEISDSDDDSPRSNSAENSKFQGGDEKKDGDSNDNDDVKPPSNLTMCVPWPNKDILYDTDFRQSMYSTWSTVRQNEKKEILFEKCKEEYKTEERNFNAAQQGSSPLSQLTKESYVWSIVSQLTSTEAVGKDRSSHSQKHIEQMTQCEHDIQGPDSVCHCSSINLQSNNFSANDSERSVFSKKNTKKSDVYLLESPEKSSNSNANDALKIEGNLLQSCEVTKEKTQEIYLNNCQHVSQQHDTSKSKLAAAEEIVEPKNDMSNSALPEPESVRYSVKNVQSASLQVPCSNSLRGTPMTQKINTETENVLMEHSQLVTEDDDKCPEICDGQQLADLKLENSQASDDIDKKQADGIYEADTKNVHQETCEAAGGTDMKQALDIHKADTNSVAQKLYETSGKTVMEVTDETQRIDVDNVAQKTCATSSDIVMKQVDKPHGANLNDVAVKERLVTNQSLSNQNSNNSAGVGHSKEESKMELYGDENGQQHFNIDKQHSQTENIAVSQLKNKQNTEDKTTENATESKTDPENLIDKVDVMAKVMQPNELEGMDVNKEKTECNFENSERLSPEVDCKVTQCEYITANSTSCSYNNECDLLTNVQETVNLKSVSNVRPEADSAVTVDTTCEDSRSQQAAELSSANLTDSDLKEKIREKNASNGHHVTHHTVTVNQNCESSRPQVAAEVSSGKLSNTNLQESLTLKDDSNVPHVANCTVSVDRSCEGSRPQPVAELSSSNLSDNNLQEKLNLRNSSNLPPVIDSSVTVDGGCEGSRPQPATELSSASLIEQLVQCQQNSRVFDPLVSLIKTKPIVGDFALRYDMMVKKELARLYQKEAKQKEKRNKKKIGAIVDSKSKKKKKKKKEQLFPGKEFCGFRDIDKDMDGCGPGKGGFSGGTLTFTAIVSSFSRDCIFNLYDNFLTKGINIRKRCKAVIKQSKGLSHTLHITCWLLYFGFQHVCPFTL